MSLIFYFCVFMTLIYVPFDLFLKPVAVDREVWFGFALTGWWAKALFMTVWCPDSRSVESNCGIPRG